MAEVYFCDGSGWNGAKAGYAITDDKGKVLIHKTFPHPYTNNEMEYTAVLKAAEMAQYGAQIFTDSQLVVNQVNGAWKVKEKKFLPVIERIRAKMKEKNLTLSWVPRKKNLAGIFLEKNK